MPDLPATFNRPFQVWMYVVSHAQLLLRSAKNNERPTNIDIAFFGVNAMSLQSLYRQLSVSAGSEAEVDALFPTRPRFSGERVYLIGGGADIGFVSCADITIVEDHKDFWEIGLDLPDMFMPKWLRRVVPPS